MHCAFHHTPPSRALSDLISQSTTSPAVLHRRNALQMMVQGHKMEAKFGPAYFLHSLLCSSDSISGGKEQMWRILIK